MNPFTVWVPGRPAPQGSKSRGGAGQLREQSPYLPAWRAAIKKAVYERYRELGVKPDDLPLLRGPIEFSSRFHLDTGQRIDSPPDLDKLLRAVWDSLTAARVWEDDGRVVRLYEVGKVQAQDGRTGADITVWQEGSDEDE